MSLVRTLMLRHRHLAMLLALLALALKAVVPAGYMISERSLVLTIEICAESTGQHLTGQIAVPRDHDGRQEPAKAAASCPFASLGTGYLPDDLAALAAIAAIFALALGFANTPLPVLSRPAFLRPPLRAPPHVPA